MNWLVYFLIGIFIAVGAGIASCGINEIYLAQASSSWPIAKGMIVSSQIESSSDSDGTTYKPAVKFSYQVEGLNFMGDKLFYGGGGISSSNYQYSQKVVSKYPNGKFVKVFYNPSQPSQAVIEAGITKKTFIQFTFGSLFLLFGAGFGLLWWLFK